MKGMADLHVAKSLLAAERAQFVLVKEGHVLARSRASGVRRLMETLDALGDAARGAALADRIVGRAVAVLACQAGIGAVHAVCLSQAARRTLEQAHILVSWDTLVPVILNRDRTGPCPLERLTISIPDVEEAAERLRTHLNTSTGSVSPERA